MLAIEVGHFPQPLVETNVVCERMTAFRAANDERCGIKARKRLRVWTHSEFSVSAEEMFQRHSWYPRFIDRDKDPGARWENDPLLDPGTCVSSSLAMLVLLQEGYFGNIE